MTETVIVVIVEIVIAVALERAAGRGTVVTIVVEIVAIDVIRAVEAAVEIVEVAAVQDLAVEEVVEEEATMVHHQMVVAVVLEIAVVTRSETVAGVAIAIHVMVVVVATPETMAAVEVAGEIAEAATVVARVTVDKCDGIIVFSFARQNLQKQTACKPLNECGWFKLMHFETTCGKVCCLFREGMRKRFAGW